MNTTGVGQNAALRASGTTDNSTRVAGERGVDALAARGNEGCTDPVDLRCSASRPEGRLSRGIRRMAEFCRLVDGPQKAAFTATDGSIVQAAPRALLAQLLPSALGGMVADVVMPRIFNESALSLLAHGRVDLGPRLQGRLRVGEGSSAETYQLVPLTAAPALRVRGGKQDFTVGIRTDETGAARFVMEGDFGTRQGKVSIPIGMPSREVGAFASTLEVAPGCEQWIRHGGRFQTWTQTAVLQRTSTAAGQAGESESQAKATPDAGATARLLRASNPFSVQRFKIGADRCTRSGFRVTNEISTAFPPFSIRGGAYLGVGSAQNYDHLTAARSDLAFLIDLDPNVAADHRGILTLVGQSRDAGHFLSMLFGVRLTPEERRMATPDLLNSILNPPIAVSAKGQAARPSRKMPDKQYQDEVCAALSQRLSRREMKDVRRIMRDAPNVLMKAWQGKYANGEQGQWLSDAERFNHLKFLQNAGRIVVRQGDLTGRHTVNGIARSLARWNSDYSPKIQVNAMYLSNAESWISGRYPRMYANVSRLPLNDEGVILRTGSFTGVKKGGWTYQTLPMADFTAAGRSRKLESNVTLNNLVGDANARQAEREQARRRAVEQLTVPG